MKKIMLILALTAFLLSSCFIPDNYEMDVVVYKDGTVEYTYQGELNYAPALEKAIDGTFDEETEEDLLAVIDNLSAMNTFRKVENLGKGKILVKVNEYISEREDKYFMTEDVKFYSFLFPEENNKKVLLIEGFEVKEDDIEDLMKFNTELKGKLTVKVEKGLKVKEQNADKKMKGDKKSTVYTWDLDYKSAKPTISIKL
jgi:hypothetical protein